ncbi:MAG: cytochrome c [Bacteroidetes bacterium]|nr:cytochrome c [Bacteroidota bacterium]
MTLLSIHKISVILFLLIYLVKTILLLANQTENLEKFKKMTKVLEMIVSAAFLITGVWMMIEIGSVKMFQLIKIMLVLASIPVAVIAYKKSNKALAVLSLFMIIMSYGLAEMSKKQKALGSDDNALNSKDVAVMGKAVYTSYCLNCHGEDGKKAFMGAFDLSVSTLDRAAMVNVISNGRKAMTPYSGVLSEEQIQAVTDYIQTLKK